MVAKKPRIVIIGAGMAGLTAANKLYTARGWKEEFELCVVEGGSRIGGRINTSEFGGDRIEMGATWIHGIGGSPVHKIAQEINALESEQPWECMDGCSEDPIIAAPTTFAEGGLELKPSLAEPISALFKFLMDFAQGKKNGELGPPLAPSNSLSIGAFVRQGLDAYWKQQQQHQDDDDEELIGCGNWTRKSLEEAVFAMHENTQRTYTSAGDLQTLDFSAESEYIMFPGEEITIAKGYLSIIESLASVLPPGLIQLGRKVTRIEWRPESYGGQEDMENGCSSSNACSRPVKLHFFDGSVLLADHVIITVSLGVLKAGIQQDSGLFDPPLPCFKTEAISRLGFGVVNKLFLQLSPTTHDRKGKGFHKFPYLQMAFHREDSEFRQKKIPWWMRRTASLFPIYENSSVLLSWFAGEEALELESLKDEQIINGVSATVSSFLTKPQKKDNPNSHELLCNGNNDNGSEVKFSKVLKSQWGGDPLFLGSYSYVAVGSSGDDLDMMAEPLPRINGCESSSSPPLQILFAGEATHRTHYSTTHGAYFSGLREASRLLQHYNFVVV